MDGQPPNVNFHRSTDTTAWYLLAEFSLKEFLSERSRSDGWMAGFLSLPLQELDTLPEWVANLEALLARFAKEVWGHSEQSGRVRLFCQRKIIGDGYLERAASPLDPAGRKMEGGQAILDPGKKIDGGWGYYAIEKGGNFADAACKESCPVIEIYVYRESIDTP